MIEKMGKSEFDDLFEKFVKGTCTEEERKTAESWFDALPDAENYIADPISAKARVWNKISAKTKTVKGNKNLRLSIIWKMAAVLAVGCAAATYFLYPRYINSEGRVSQHGNHDKNIFSNSETMPRQVKLDDGSEVRLEPNSILKIVSMTADKRAVYLEGTAFFNVVRNPQRPFYVHTKSLVTKVLGTSFTVIALPAQKEEVVQVKTGKVAVFANSKELKMMNAVTITPNHQVKFDGVMGKLTKSLVEAPAIIKGDFTQSSGASAVKTEPFIMEFEERPVSEILEALKDVYGVNIVYDKQKLFGCYLTTTLSDENLYTRLEIICKAMGGTYVVEGTAIEVIGASCRKENK